MNHRPPNIILTIADDQRATALGCAGVEPVCTPFLDRLATRGTHFANSHHLGSPHGAVCAPSRAMLMTGLPYFRLDPALISCGSEAEASPPLPPTLPQLLRERGYHTFATGKWHNGAALFHASFSSGATLFFGGMADHWFTPVHEFDASGRYAPGDARLANGFSTEIFAQSAIDFIRSRRNNSEPFFCYCAFTAPHDPRTPPDAYRRLYPPASIELPPNIVANQPFDKGFRGVAQPPDNGSLSIRDEMLLGVPRDPAEIRRSLAEYYGMISHMDEWIGKIHETIAETGIGENTIIVHTADHGLAVGQHGLLGKQNLYNHSATVPLLMAGPGVPSNHRDTALRYQHDLHPTLLEWAGAAQNSPAFFQPLLPADPDQPTRSCLGAAFAMDQRMVRNECYKLIEYHSPTERIELFDLLNDPWETTNIAGNPGLAATIAGLTSQLREWQISAGDPLVD